MKNIDPAELLSYGVHLGHKKNKVHPKAQKFIHSMDNGVSIIDLFQTADYLAKAIEFATQLGSEGKVLMVVGSKKIARETLNKLCEEHDITHMTNKWVGGFLTNFDTVLKNIQKMNQLKEEETSGGWEEHPKHERTALHKKLHRIETIYGGVAKIAKIPDALFVIDIRKEKNSIMEATQRGIPTIAMVDTNVNPVDITYPIPANDDAILSIQYIAEAIIKAYADAKAKGAAKEAKIKEKEEKAQA